jgi:hypothetical protein
MRSLNFYDLAEILVATARKAHQTHTVARLRFKQPRKRVSGLKRRDDALELTQSLESL